MEISMKTVLITGCSTGFGLETARYFLDRGWRVLATMRNPANSALEPSDRLTILPLDVTDAGSIAAAMAAAGPVDVLVNNAGVGWLNAHEGTSDEMIRHLFATNTFGTMAMCRALLPVMRERGGGTIINVTSSVTLKSLALLSAYAASKAATAAFTASLAAEVADFGICVREVIPGQSSATEFSANASDRIQQAGGFPPAYAAVMEQAFAHFSAVPADAGTQPIDVAEAVWRAATEDTCPQRLPAGADAEAWFAAAQAPATGFRAH
jgi:NAD(P)-dependent dehydrogenase (short-subunit alcohol dehydrogenase family)